MSEPAPNRSTFVLIHGGGSNAHYWYRVVPGLVEAGHEVIAPNLPAGDDSAGFMDYADAVIAEVGDDKSNVVVVGQSMGALTAPIVAEEVTARLIVLLAPMIPAPGETPDQWGTNVGLTQAQQRYAKAEGFDPRFDMMTTFMHDVPRDVVAELMAAGEPEQSTAILGEPFPLDSWPDVPTKVLACMNDRLFPLDLVRRLARDRLGIEVDEIESGHLCALAHPGSVVAKLNEYVARLR